MNIGSKGLTEVDLIIPQSTSLTFDITHYDMDGKSVDHTASVVNMAFQSRDGTETIDLDEYCEGTSTGVHVFLPPSVSENLPLGKMLWDMIVTMSSGEQVRMAYGTVTIVDTYALDGE